MYQSYFENSDVKMPNNIENDDIPNHDHYCYWLCNREAKLKVYTDFGNILHLCKRCYEIYDPAHRLKTEEM
jgi:hypothetical protein